MKKKKKTKKVDNSTDITLPRFSRATSRFQPNSLVTSLANVVSHKLYYTIYVNICMCAHICILNECVYVQVFTLARAPYTFLFRLFLKIASYFLGDVHVFFFSIS